ncbi:50S ribosomal protein L9 [bacterium]|jgi:large subunit ribosomal protein L9|nr:50S ribosomal protein L9 [bacterium]
MKVILSENVDKLGKIGDVANVAPGHARNYLFPKKLAVAATDANMRFLKKKSEKEKKKEEQIVQSARDMVTRLSDVSCTISAEAGEEDKLFGSVTTADIAKVLKDEGLEIDKKQIELDSPIKKLGVYNVVVNLYRDVKATFKLWVVKK